MVDLEPSRVPVWQIPRLDAGYIYLIEAGRRLKIGKARQREPRVRAAKTWLPDMTILGVKPFWNVDQCEKNLHEGLAQSWYSGEWFDLFDDPYREDFIANFKAFSDDDANRDQNSINFLYWMHDFLEIEAERGSRNQRLRPFQRDVSGAKKGGK
jgi:hypothetical protein